MVSLCGSTGCAPAPIPHCDTCTLAVMAPAHVVCVCGAQDRYAHHARSLAVTPGVLPVLAAERAGEHYVYGGSLQSAASVTTWVDLVLKRTLILVYMLTPHSNTPSYSYILTPHSNTHSVCRICARETGSSWQREHCSKQEIITLIAKSSAACSPAAPTARPASNDACPNAPQ